jgi:hypothetical protein
LKVEFTLTPDDYIALMRVQVQNPAGKSRWIPYLVVGFFLLAMLLKGAALVGNGVSWLVVVGATLFLEALMFIVSRFLKTLIQKMIVSVFRRGDRLLPTCLSLEARPEGLSIVSKNTASLITWEGINRIVVTSTHVFFYSAAVYILPRRAFEDEREFEEFVESARIYHEAGKLMSATRSD